MSFTGTSLLTLFLLVALTECRMSGGSRSSPSRPSGGHYTPSRPHSPPPRPPPTGGSSNYGWTKPQNSPSHPSPPSSQNYGATKPKTETGQNAPHPPSAPSTYGWTKTNTVQKSPNPPSLPHPPSAPNTPSLPHPSSAPNAPSAPTTYGWTKPKTDTGQNHPPTPVSNKPPPPMPPRLPPSPTHQNVPHNQQSNSPRVHPATVNQRSNHTNRQYNGGQTSHPQNQYNTGTKYEKGYSKGYDQGYQRGVQQSTRINPAYYPPQNHFGYPGQGIYAGSGSPTYQGMSVYGSPNHYGYPVSSSYGYQTYGSGNHDLRNGLLLGLAGGYLLNSALHSNHHSSVFPTSSFPSSNPWGYSGAGYGSDYHYTRIEKTTTINNNYFNDAPKKEAEGGGVPENWVQCVAYDPMTDTTLTNPNCTCSVTVETNTTSNLSVANHNCSTVWGHQVEKTPVSDVEVFNPNFASNQVNNPEKVKQVEVERKRMEAYKELEKLLNMGSFTG